MNKPTEKRLHRLFEVGLILKGIDGVLETIGGLVLLVVSPQNINRLVAAMTQYELVEDPNDFFANLIRHAVHFNAKSQLWAAAFLLSHGILKLLIIAGLFLNKLWAYPVGIAVFTGLGFYQIYRYWQTGSPGLLILTALDVFVILLTWLEFRAIKRERKTR